MKHLKILCLGALFACASGGHITSIQSFEEVPMGATQAEVREFIGDPISEKKLPDGSIEYVYVERFKAGNRNLFMRRYYIVMKDGVVVSKRVEERQPEPFRAGVNSYHLQTTQNESAPTD